MKLKEWDSLITIDASSNGKPMDVKNVSMETEMLIIKLTDELLNATSAANLQGIYKLVEKSRAVVKNLKNGQMRVYEMTKK